MNKVHESKAKHGTFVQTITEKLFRKRKLNETELNTEKTEETSTKTELKGIKVWSLQEPKSRKGLAVRNYNELLTKIKSKFSSEVYKLFIHFCNLY